MFRYVLIKKGVRGKVLWYDFFDIKKSFLKMKKFLLFDYISFLWLKKVLFVFVWKLEKVNGK